MDNIRTYLTILVILHHISIGYGGAGGWLLYEADFNPIDNMTVILFTLFNAINQSYFMAFFFLLAGYFTPPSFEKKGGRNFFRGRLVRLGIPLVVYAAIVSPIVEFAAKNYAYGLNITFAEIMVNRMSNLVIGVDHLWFLMALLIFSGMYVIYRSYRPSTESTPWYMNSFPRDRILILATVALGGISFVVRTVSPIGVTFVVNFQLGHFTHYVFMFWIGILAYYGGWFDSLSRSQATRWIGVAVLTLVTLPLIVVAFVNLESPDFAPFMGGLTLESLVYSFWEGIALISISIGVLHVFKTRLNRTNRIAGNMGGSAYTAYIIHAIVVVCLMILLIPVALPAMVKFFIVALVGVPLIFFLSALIRKIPYFSRVLG
ncbi:MAG: acyltransferase family protein [Candidatus Thorarchaeota archaeon]|nr:MAG: acyltransferase family protein [Candidatus Thorarchaeota archaeon]